MKFKCTGIVILIVFMTFLSAGCGSSGGGGDDGGESDSGDSTTNGGSSSIDSVSVTNGAPATGIVANGASQTLISATVLDTTGNNVADGTTVSFTTTAGDIDSSTAGIQTTYSSTTTTGVASATLTSPTNVGSANITATAGGVSDTTSVSFTPGAVNSILLTATPNNLTADSSSSSTIRALVTDVNGNAVANGEIISFSVTSGTGVLSAPTAATTGGAATVTYTASDTAGTETVTAVATNATTKIVNITLIDASIGSVTVTSGTASIVADGASQTLISATVLDTTGNNVADGTTVSFATTAGDIDSSTAGIQTTHSSTTTNGVASATLTSPTNVGSANITATAGGVSDTTSVSFIPGAVNSILLTATPNNVTADSSSSSTIRAFVTDVNGNAVANGEIISFSVTSGTGVLSAPTAATSGGAATVTYTASDTAGTETVTAVATNATTKIVNITLIDASIGSVTVTSGTASIVADGASQTLISATVLDTTGNNVADGTTVSFTTTAGDIDSSTAGIQTTYSSTTTNGVASATLTSPTNVGSANITATAGGVSDTTSVSFTPGAVNSILLTATPNNLTADSSSSSTIRAFVTDVNGNAVANGEIISFSVTSGTGVLSAPTAATSGGAATVTYTASDTAGTETVTAVATNATTKIVNITLIDASIGSVTVTSGTASIVADGASQTLISATALDTTGNNVADGTTVSFATTAGDIDSSTAGIQTTYSSTTTNGVASATLTSPTNVGSANITATAGGVSDTTSVSFTPGAVNSILLTATPNNLTADSSSSSTIRAFVTDVNGNAVANGEIISFSVTSGTGVLSAPTAATSGGAATVTYTASDTAGTETVTAVATNATTKIVNITLIDASIGSVTVTSGTASIVADGASQTLISATALDTTGNNVADGTTVSFATTAGDIDSSTAGIQTTYSSTTTNGVASATLTSPTNVGSANITATAGGVSDTTSVSFTPGAVNSILLTATPNNLTADSSSSSTIRAFVTDVNGNAVANGEIISFSVTSGTGVLSAPTAATSGGAATVTYTASDTAGTETVTAEATNGTTETVDIALITEQVGNIALSLGTASLVADGQNSTIVSATITNIQGNNVLDGTSVTFTTTGGDIDSIAGDQLSVTRSTSNGVASTILRSSTTAGQYVVTATAGGISQLASVEFVPGPADVAGTTLSANPTVIVANGVSTSLITASVVDENNNPVADGATVNFYTTAGGLSHASSATANGIATVVLTSSTTNETATVTAIVDSVSRTVDITFGTGPGTGEPVYIIITVDPENIRVKGTGGIESAVVTASVKDENGQPYNDSADNIKFEILTGPGGGEVLDSGDGSPSASGITTTTVGGIATVSLNSGTISGTVRVQVTVLKDGGGGVLAPANQIIAISTQIGIEAGDPFNVTLYKAPEIEDNGDGSMSWIISAMLQDQYGNPVADNTGVYFGLVDNEPDGYKSSGANGITNGTATFTSAGTNFTGDGVVQFDTLIILEGRDEGGNTIDTPADGSVTLFYTPTGSETGLDFVAGNAELGVICGVVPTGNLEPDATCTPTGGIAIKGVTHTRLTWAEPAILEPFYLYAETEGRNVGQSLAMSYPGVAPVAIDVTLDPNSVLSGTENIAVNAHFHDGANPAHNIRNKILTFKTDNTSVSGFGVVGIPSEIATTNVNGMASVSNLATQGCLDTDTDVTISVSYGQYIGTATLTIQASGPTANFTSTDVGDSDHVIFTDTSETPSGTVIDEWSWDFDDDGAEDHNGQYPPTQSFDGAGNYPVTLTVTNNLGCAHTTAKVITVP